MLDALSVLKGAGHTVRSAPPPELEVRRARERTSVFADSHHRQDWARVPE